MPSTTKNYRITNQLNAFEQLNIARKLGPALPIVDMWLKEENEDKPRDLPIILMLGQLDESSYNHIVKMCLSVVSRIQDDGRSSRLTASDGSLMFDDTPMSDIVELIAQVIKANLGDFLRTSLSRLSSLETQTDDNS